MSVGGAGVAKSVAKYFIHVRVHRKRGVYSMLVEKIDEILVPKYYKSRGALIEDAFKALMNLKPELKVEIAVELYLKEEISLSRAAEIAGMDLESFKALLKARGLKVRSYMGTKEEIENGMRSI